MNDQQAEPTVEETAIKLLSDRTTEAQGVALLSGIVKERFQLLLAEAGVALLYLPENKEQWPAFVDDKHKMWFGGHPATRYMTKRYNFDMDQVRFSRGTLQLIVKMMIDSYAEHIVKLWSRSQKEILTVSIPTLDFEREAWMGNLFLHGFVGHDEQPAVTDRSSSSSSSSSEE